MFPHKKFATTVIVAVAVFIFSPWSSAQKLNTLYVFQGGTDGERPNGPILDANGDIYGDTQNGGSRNDGMIFELTSHGKEVSLHSFDGKAGFQPYSALTRSENGTLYGTTTYGDTYGVVFQAVGHHFAVLHNFVGDPDGAFPFGRLLRNGDGAIYGTTAQGGTGPCGGGCGTIFSIDRSRREAVLHSFSGPDGAYPAAGLIIDSAGNFYGTTRGGGNNNSCSGGCGTIFKMKTDHTIAVLHNFQGGKDGAQPSSELFRDWHGNLYGTTLGGGADNMGTVFEITSAGKYKVLHRFRGVPDGAVGASPLAQAPDGDLYGVTYNGGRNCKNQYAGCGAIYKIDTSGNYSVVYRFNGLSDGAGPQGSIVIDLQGNIYGSTLEGPWDGCRRFHGGCGTLWKFSDK